MRNVLLLVVSLIMSVNAFGYEQIVDSKWDELLTSKSMSNINDYTYVLEKLKGETITFKIDYWESEKLQCFLNVEPDTVWIKKPKKNPQLNKDYKLMPYYHGIGEYDEKAYYQKDKRYTPAEVMTNTSFYVDSVFKSYQEPCLVLLTNLQNNEKLVWAVSSGNRNGITVMSESLGSKMINEGTVLYKNFASSYSTPKAHEFSPYSVQKAIFKWEISRYSFYPKLDIYLRGNGETLVYTYDKAEYKRSYSTPKYLAQTDYDIIVDGEKDFELNTIVDFKTIKYDFPFSFRTIWGETKTSSSVYQKICGKNSYSDIRGYLGDETYIRIAGKQSIHGIDYYIATCYGKCFYIPVSNVSLKTEEIAKLDSLLNSPKEAQEMFFEVTKGFELYQYTQDTKKILGEFDSFKKYGLSIVKWSVYDESDYTDGTGIRFTFYNPTKSMIKYITITFVGYNAVDDPVGRALTKKCIGPIEPDESGEYQFEYAWFTDIVEYAKIRSIKVDYKNGTSKTITNVSNIEWSEELYDFFVNPPLKDLKTLSVTKEE